MSDTKVEDKSKKTNWAELSEGDEEDIVDTPINNEDAAEDVKPVYIPPKMPGKKNKNGDYVVTSLDIVDTRTGVKKEKKDKVEEESSSDEGYGDEDDNNEAK